MAPYKEVELPPSDPDLWIFRRRSVESFVNDLLVGRGVVLGRAVLTLRSIETRPLTRDSSIFFLHCVVEMEGIGIFSAVRSEISMPAGIFLVAAVVVHRGESRA